MRAARKCIAWVFAPASGQCEPADELDKIDCLIRSDESNSEHTHAPATASVRPGATRLLCGLDVRPAQDDPGVVVVDDVNSGDAGNVLDHVEP